MAPALPELLGTFFWSSPPPRRDDGRAFPDTISRAAAVIAPALMVLAVILFMGKISALISILP